MRTLDLLPQHIDLTLELPARDTRVSQCISVLSEVQLHIEELNARIENDKNQIIAMLNERATIKSKMSSFGPLALADLVILLYQPPAKRLVVLLHLCQMGRRSLRCSMC